MRKLSDKQAAILNLLHRQKAHGYCTLTAPEITMRLAPTRTRDWAWSGLGRLEELGLIRRSGTKFLGAPLWDITEAGMAALLRAARE